MGIWDRLTRQLDELSEELVPDPLRLRVEEARTLMEAGHHVEAIRRLETVIRVRPDHALALYLLGYGHKQLGDHAAAHDAYAKAALHKPGFVEALLGLGLTSVELGRPEMALEALRKARDGAGGSAHLLAAAYRGMGKAHLALGDEARAIRELRKALVEDARDLEAATLLGRLALEGTERTADPRGLLRAAMAPGDASPEAQARAEGILGRLELATGHVEGAELALRKALVDLPADDAERGRVLEALVDCAVRLGDPEEAEARMDQALAAAPDDPALQARRLTLELAQKRDPLVFARSLTAALARFAVGESEAQTPYDRANRLLGLTEVVPLLAAHEGEALGILRAHDSPLLVVVMGEFSTGKSTFVNAFLGEDIAATGVRPTTSVILVMRYGAEAAGRVVYLDGTSEDVPWKQLAPRLGRIDDAEAARIRRVEVRYPNDILERVHIIDTPGLNAVLPEHERTARAFVTEADAVVWLFAASQAGKQTEREALEQVREHGKHVVGVINKIDQLGADEVAEVTRFLGENLGELVETLVPLSARQALQAKQSEDSEILARSGWPALQSALDERFFARALTLKAQTCQQHVTRLVGRLTGELEVQGEAHREAIADADARAQQLHTAAEELLRDGGLERAVHGVRRATSDLYRQAAEEILELVRPRRLPFGSNRATRADRDYIIGFLETGIPVAVDEALADVSGALTAAGVEDADRALGQVRDRYLSYVRGLLRGGRIDQFFSTTLARLQLEPDAVYHALVQAAPDVERELGEPLGETSKHLVHGQRQATRADRTRHVLALFEIEDVLLPLVGPLG